MNGEEVKERKEGRAGDRRKEGMRKWRKEQQGNRRREG